MAWHRPRYSVAETVPFCYNQHQAAPSVVKVALRQSLLFCSCTHRGSCLPDSLVNFSKLLQISLPLLLCASAVHVVNRVLTLVIFVSVAVSRPQKVQRDATTWDMSESRTHSDCVGKLVIFLFSVNSQSILAPYRKLGVALVLPWAHF